MNHVPSCLCKDDTVDARCCEWVVVDEVEDLRAENSALRSALMKAAAHAGHPDAEEGCRLVIRTVKDALKGPQ